MFCFFFFRTFAPSFQFKFYSFCWRGAQECFLLKGAGYPSYATDFNTKPGFLLSILNIKQEKINQIQTQKAINSSTAGASICIKFLGVEAEAQL